LRPEKTQARKHCGHSSGHVLSGFEMCGKSAPDSYAA
jgi:hypothetical protein